MLNITFLSPEFFKMSFEWTCVGLFLICLLHSFKTYGKERTIREFSAGFILSAGCETLGVLSGAYVYPGFSIYLYQIPLVNPLSWVALVYLVMHISNTLIPAKRSSNSLWLFLLLAILDSSMALAVDLMMDPLATVYNWWIWVDPSEASVVNGTVDAYNFTNLTHLETPVNWLKDFYSSHFSVVRYPTHLFGIPLINFISWFVFVLVFSFQFRLIENTPKLIGYKKTLWLLILVLVEIPLLGILLITPNI